MRGLKLIILLVLIVNGRLVLAQVVGPAPTGTAAVAENNPYANFHQKWTPMMQKLMQQVKNDDEYVTYYVGAQVGSPYEYEDFKKGKIYYGDEFLADTYYRYNAFSNEIEVKQTLLKEEKHKALLADKELVLVPVNGQEMRFMTFITKKNKTKNGYLTLLYDGEQYKLYKHLSVKFTEAKPAANSMVNAIPSRFSHFIEYYLKEKNTDRIDEILPKKSAVLKLLPKELANEVKVHLKDSKLDLTEEQDLVNLFTFLNTL